MELQAVLCRARDLLLAQGMEQCLQYLTEDEATRFLLANKLNVSRSAEALVQRAKFKAKFQLNTVAVCMELKLAFPMHWINDTMLLLRITPQKHLPTMDALVEQDLIDFVYYVGECIATRCDTHQYRRIAIEVWFADFVQDTRLAESLLGIAARHVQSQHPERIKSISLVNFPTFLHTSLQVQIKRLLPAEMLRMVKFCDVTENDDDVVVGESIYEGVDFTKEKSTDNLADDDEIATLFAMLESSIQRAEQIEMINLEANARMRAKLAHPPIEEDHVSSELRQRLVNETAEVEALKRAVAFARNFMDLEERERRDFQAEMEQTIATKQHENKSLLEKLQNTFGNDAQELLKQ